MRVPYGLVSPLFYRLIGVAALLASAVAFAVGQTSNSARDPGGPELLSCSPAPCVLTPTQASPGGFDAPIAADPVRSQNLIVGSDYTKCPYPENSAFNLTFDGGSNWSDLFCMEPLFYKGNEYYPGGGPILGYDLNGVAYIGGYYAPDDSDQSNLVFEGFQKSSDEVNWSAPAPAVFRPNDFPQDCWMAVDANAGSPYVNSVYVSCVIEGPASGPPIVVSHSGNGGEDWQQVGVAPPQDFNDPAYTTMTVGRDGTVYLVWKDCTQNNGCYTGTVYMVFSKSTDGGSTWSNPKAIAPVNLIYPLPNTKNVFVPDGPVIAVDASDGPYSGNLYVAMYNWTGTFMQMQVIRSTDGGDTWSKPVPVSPGVTHDQFLPWISVSPTGLVGASWLDRRNDPKNIDYQAYAGLSSDGGLTFENVQLTTAFSNPNKPMGQDIGYYTGNTWDGPNYFIAAWMDNSQSYENEDFVGGIRLK